MRKEIFMLALTFFLAIFCAGCNSSKDSVSITKDEAHSFVDDDLRIGDIRDMANTENGFYGVQHVLRGLGYESDLLARP